MADQGISLHARNRELGALLLAAREKQQRTVSECAALLGTSRRRYRAIEQGATPIFAAELEALVRFLELPPEQAWGPVLPRLELGRVTIQARPGQTLQFV